MLRTVWFVGFEKDAFFALPSHMEGEWSAFRPAVAREQLESHWAHRSLGSQPLRRSKRGAVLTWGGWRGAWREAEGTDKRSFAWPPVSVISQRESLISKKVVNLLASVCPCLLRQEGAKLVIWLSLVGPACKVHRIHCFAGHRSLSLLRSYSLTLTQRHTFSNRPGISPLECEIKNCCCKKKHQRENEQERLCVWTGLLSYLFKIQIHVPTTDTRESRDCSVSLKPSAWGRVWKREKWRRTACRESRTIFKRQRTNKVWNYKPSLKCLL